MLEGIKNRIIETEEEISELEDGMLEITAMKQSKEWKEIRIVSENSGTTLKSTNIQVIGIPEEEEKEKVPEKIFEDIIDKKFPYVGKGTLTHVL